MKNNIPNENLEDLPINAMVPISLEKNKHPHNIFERIKL
jgi:hypothetical protein